MQFQDTRYEVTEKEITETNDVVTKIKFSEEYQVSVERELLEPEPTIVSGFNEQTLPQNNISGHYIAPIL